MLQLERGFHYGAIEASNNKRLFSTLSEIVNSQSEDGYVIMTTRAAITAPGPCP